MTTEQSITLDMRLLRAVFHHASTDTARPGLCGVQVVTDDENNAVAYLATDAYTLATAAPTVYIETWRNQMTTTLNADRLTLIPSAVIKAAKTLGAGPAVLTFSPQSPGSSVGTWTWREIGGKGVGASVVDAIGYGFPAVDGLLRAELVPFAGEVVALNGDYLARWAGSAMELVRHMAAKHRMSPPVRLLGLHGWASSYSKAPVRIEIRGQIGSVFGLHMPARVDD